jgi:5-methylthioadenosine/S-adenosylhomocysteine deaminase
MFLKNIRLFIDEHGNIEENKTIGEDKTGEVFDASEYIAIHGFANMHTHAAMTLFRGYAEDMNLHNWLKAIWEKEAKLKPAHVYAGTLLAGLEMLKSGITCFNDMYFFPDKVKKAAQKLGINVMTSQVIFDSNADNITNPGDVVSPHSIYTCSKETLLKAKQAAGERFIHIHLSETKKEVDDCIYQHSLRPVEYLEKIGLLSDKLIAVHCGFLNEKECQILNNYNVRTVHCPTSNMKLGTKAIFTFTKLNNIFIGTDGPASNNSLNMFSEMKTALLMQKNAGNFVTVKDIFAASTKNIFGFTHGLTLININRPELKPLTKHRLLHHLIYSFSGPVDYVVLNNKFILQNGKHENEYEIYETFEKAVEDLFD